MRKLFPPHRFEAKKPGFFLKKWKLRRQKKIAKVTWKKASRLNLVNVMFKCNAVLIYRNCLGLKGKINGDRQRKMHDFPAQIFFPLSHYIAPYPGSLQRSSTLIHVYKPLSSSHYCPKGRSYLWKIKRKPSQIKRVNLSFLKRQIYQKWVENGRFSRCTLPFSKIFIPLSKNPVR